MTLIVRFDKAHPSEDLSRAAASEIHGQHAFMKNLPIIHTCLKMKQSYKPFRLMCGVLTQELIEVHDNTADRSHIRWSKQTLDAGLRDGDPSCQFDVHASKRGVQRIRACSMSHRAGGIRGALRPRPLASARIATCSVRRRRCPRIIIRRGRSAIGLKF